MSAIPEELIAEARKIAQHAASHIRNNADAEAVVNIVTASVARALMAERERAARIAFSFTGYAHRSGYAPDVAHAITAAILKEPKP